MDNNSELVTATKRKIIKPSQSLSSLAKQLQSERDRQRYIKVIEMSQTIQSKLEHLHIKNGDNIITVRRTKQQQKYRHSIIRPVEDSDNEDDKEFEYLDDDDSILFYDDKKKYNTYSGRSFRMLDKKTSIQFLQPSSLSYHKRTSADTIWVDLCMDQGDKKNQIIYMKPKKRQSSSSATTTNTKQIWNMNKVTSIPPTPTPSPDIKMDESESESEESEESEEEGNSRTIHIAVRRDASLFTIEKTPKPSNHRQPIYPPPTLPEATIPVAPKRAHSKHEEVASQRDIPSLVNSDQNAFLSAGLLTPPHSPQGNIQPLAMRFDDDEDDDENDDDYMHSYPPIIHVQKKAHQSLKGFITRSYQLNHLTVTKTSSTSSGLFFKAIDNQTKHIKYLLKVLIKSLSSGETERQKRFGFTFLWQKPFFVEEAVRQYDDAKFALAPDSLVKEALMTWINFLKEEGGYGERVPCLLKADSILRDGRKLYVVYDSSLLSI